MNVAENSETSAPALQRDGTVQPMTPAEIAAVCHEANRAYCWTQNDDSQKTWVDAPHWQRVSAIDGVMHILDNPDSTPEDSHRNWLKVKRENGWTYGPVKDETKREHPCFVPYDQLPVFQQRKDHLFRAIVLALKG